MTKQLTLLIVLSLGLCLYEDTQAQQRSKKGVVSAIKKKIRKLGPNRNRQPTRENPNDVARDILNEAARGGTVYALEAIKVVARSSPNKKHRNTARAKLSLVQDAMARALDRELGNASTESVAQRIPRGDGPLINKIQLLRRELAPTQTSETGGNEYPSQAIKNAHECVSAAVLQNLYLKANRNGNALLDAYARGDIGLREIRAAASRYSQRGAPQNLHVLTKVLKNKAERMAEIRRYRDQLGNSDQVANHLRQLMTAERLPIRLQGINLRNRYFKAAAALPAGNLYGDHARATLAKLQAQPVPNITPVDIPTGASIQLESAKARSRALNVLKGRINPAAATASPSRNHAQLAQRGRPAAGPVRPIIYEQLPAQINPNYDRVPPIINSPPIHYTQLP